MKLTKKSMNLLISSIYIIVLFLSASSYFKIEILDSIRRTFVVILPSIISLLILFDNRKNIKVLFKNKIPLVLYFLTLLWFFLTILFGIRIGIESLKGFIHFAVLITFLLILFNCEFTNEEKRKIKKHIFISFSIVMILGILQYVFKYNLNTYNNAKYPGIFGRINSTFFIATLLDKYIVMMFPIITYELLKDKDNKFYKILLILSMLGITFTFSRSGQLIYLVMSFIFFVITLFKKQFKNSVLMVVLICIMILIPGAKYSVQSALDYAYETVHMPKILQIDFVDILSSHEEKELVKDVEAGKCADDDCVGDEEGSKFFRDYYKSVGMQFLKEYPVFGIGTGNYYYLYANQNAKDYLNDDSVISDEYPYMYPHSGYVQLLAETGYIGFILFICYLLSFAIIKLKQNKDNLNLYVLLMLIMAIGIGNITECLFHSKQIIYMFVILFSIYCNLDIILEKNTKKARKTK